jgi:hypothetical protein
MRRIFVVAIFLGGLPFLGMVAIEQSGWKSIMYWKILKGLFALRRYKIYTPFQIKNNSSIYYAKSLLNSIFSQVHVIPSTEFQKNNLKRRNFFIYSMYRTVYALPSMFLSKLHRSSHVGSNSYASKFSTSIFNSFSFRALIKLETSET